MSVAEAILVYAWIAVMIVVLGWPRHDADMFWRRKSMLFVIAAIAPLLIVVVLPVWFLMYAVERWCL